MRAMLTVISLFLALAVTARADRADVHLADGRVLRGDVTVTEAEVVIRNAAGELRFDRRDVTRVEPLPAPADDDPRPTTQPDDAEPIEEPEPEEPEVDDGEPRRARLPAAPLLSDRDIQRLKLAEFRIGGDEPGVRVRFPRKSGQPAVDDLVSRDLALHPEFGQAAVPEYRTASTVEKLQMIMRATGMKYADRIDVQGDPEAFATFRRRVLPAVVKGCARGGCHGSGNAQVFRFPSGSRQTEAFVYTSFLLLDQTGTQHGPLINRDDPSTSVLLDYLLPREDNPKGHPDPGRGRRYIGEIRNSKHKKYQEVLNWINSLRVPHPGYDLHYKLPVWRTGKEQGEAADGPPDADAASSQPVVGDPDLP